MSSWFISLLVQSIIPTAGIITGVAKVLCAIVLLKSDISDDYIFLTLLSYSFEILSLFRGPMNWCFHQFPIRARMFGALCMQACLACLRALWSLVCFIKGCAWRGSLVQIWQFYFFLCVIHTFVDAKRHTNVLVKKSYDTKLMFNIIYFYWRHVLLINSCILDKFLSLSLLDHWWWTHFDR